MPELPCRCLRAQLLLVAVLIGGGADAVSVVRANRTSVAPHLDGSLEAVWQTADSAKNFIQRTPNEGQPATESTTVYVLSDDANLYVAFKCYARPDRLNLQVVPRDNRLGESVGLLLDTFDDRTTGYYFCVNAKGVQFDGRFSDDGLSWDKSWDGIWFSAARVADYGYCVEMRIPFKAIRFRPGLTEWGVNFDRYVPRRDEQSDWALQRHRTLKVSQCGRLKGIQAQSQGLNLELYPVGLVRPDTLAVRHVSAEAGLDLAWYPGSASSVQLTVNPDFAQIEADPTQVNLTRYEPYLEERRPFFVEGADVFTLGAYGFNLFYSRRVGKSLPAGGAVPILAGLKGITKFERFEVGALAAVCQETTYARDTLWSDTLTSDTFPVPRDTARLSYYTAARLRRAILRNSSVGLLYASAENPLLHNRALAGDLALRQGDFSLDGNLALSQYEKESSARRALAGRGVFYWRGDVYSARLVYTNIPRDFDVQAIGFQSSKVESYSLSGAATYPDLGGLRTLTPGVFVNRSRDHDDTLHRRYSTNGTVSLSGEFTNNWGVGFDISAADRYEYVADYGVTPPIDSLLRYASRSASVWGGSDASQAASFSFYLWGENGAWNYQRHYLAPDLFGELDLAWRITPALVVAGSVENTVEIDTLGRLAQMNWIVSPELRYALAPNLHLRLSGEAVPADRTARLELLLSWNPRPKTWLYLAWNDGHDQIQGFSRRFPFLAPPLRSEVYERIGVLKLRYLFYF